MRRLSAAVIALLALISCHPKGGEKPVVKDAWVRLAVVPGRPAAGYFTVKGSAANDRLLSIDSAVVDKIELHEGGMSAGMTTMRPLAELQVPAGATVELAPGGNHAMLFGIDQRITPGTAIPMVFTFASGARIPVEAKTVPAGGDGDMGGMHH